MFSEFENQIYTPSASVVITNNTDCSISGGSKKIVFSDINETCTISFDSVDLSQYEEISFYINQAQFISSGNIFKITIDGSVYNFEQIDRGWSHILIDCSGMGSVSSIVIESLVSNLTLFLDVLGYRKVTYNSDVDLIEALKNNITLDYGVSTTLSADVLSGATSISLASTAYINDTSILEIDNGAGIIEEVELVSKSGLLSDPITNSFTSGDIVRVLCPTLSQQHDSIEPDPICGVVVYNKQSKKDEYLQKVKDGHVHKFYLGVLGIIIYIDCTSDKKLFQLSREFDLKYGDRFQILLDGELVDIYLESTIYAESVIGNNPRMSYFYEIQPQPYKDISNTVINTINLTIESEESR